MRILRAFPLLLLVSAALAGCADLETPTNGAGDSLTFLEEGLVASHPDYGFLVHDALLESPEPGMIFSDIDGVRVWYKTPYHGVPDLVSEITPLSSVEGVSEGHGITTFGSLAVTGGTSAGMQIVDISDPSAPKVIGVSNDSPVRDADTILYPDGRLIVISSAGGSTITATEITDPTNPSILGTFETSGSNHNIAVVPGSPIVYNSNQDIIDYSDPTNPVEVGNFNEGGGCHDIAFYMNRTADKIWGLCAGYAETEIWDIHDASAPVIIAKIPFTATNGIPVAGNEVPNSAGGQTVPRVPGTLSHLAIVNHDATVLIMGDETGGGAANGCDVYYEGPDGQTFSGPAGNLYFYDITDPENPVLHGHVSPSYTDADPPGPNPNDPTALPGTGSCTAHFGEVVGKTTTVVMSFYTAGLVLVDFSDLDNPRIVNTWDDGGDIWDVQFHQGYLVTGDMTRGMDILTLS
jgi:hypothetical protein